MYIYISRVLITGIDDIWVGVHGTIIVKGAKESLVG